MNIYVGNVSNSVNEDDLRKAFEEFGEVTSANVIKDKFTGESRGFGFVEMNSEDQGQAAISGLDGVDLKGRNLTVNVARPRKDFRSQDGGGGNRGGSFNRSNNRSSGGGGGGGGRKRY